MKATELRIGNIVNTMNGVQSVMGIDTSDERGEYVIFNDGRKFGHYIEHNGEPLIEPIPLTEEWLERFGFIRQGKRDMWVKDRLCVELKELPNLRRDWVSGWYIGLKDLGNCLFHSFMMLEYVHTLQNLVHALTGEELELKP